MVARGGLLLLAALTATGCIEFVGSEGGPCSLEELCSGNLVCVADQCVTGSVACEGKCGNVGGVDCGGCSNSGEVCSPNNVCRVPCERFSCGQDLGVDCGSCSSDSQCNNRQCEKICPGRCGMVAGQDCGGCGDVGLCLATRCEPVFDCTTPPEIVQSEDAWWAVIGVSIDYEPLCSGWIVRAAADNRISVVNALDSQMTGPSWQFQGSARALYVRFSERAIYAVVGPPYEFVRLDMLDGSQQRIPLDVSLNDSPRFFDADPELLLLSNNRVSGGRLFTLQSSPPAVISEQPLPFYLGSPKMVAGERRLFALSSTAAHRFLVTDQGALVEEEQLVGNFTALAVAPIARRLLLSPQRQREPLMEVGFDDLQTVLGAYGSTEGLWHHRPKYHPSETFVIATSEQDQVIYQWDTVNRVSYRQGSRIFNYNYENIKWAPDAAHAYAIKNERLFFIPTPGPQ